MKKEQKAPSIKYEYFFVRNKKYEDAIKEADALKKEGWNLRRWHYEATTLTFILTMERAIEIAPEPEKEEEENKPWRRTINKTGK